MSRRVLLPPDPPARVPLRTPKKQSSENRLLAALPARSRQHFLEDCEQVELGFADVLCEAGERLRHVYFPTDSFISLIVTLDEGARLEVGIIGDEGMLGTSLILGVNTSAQHAVVQGAGSAWQISASDFNRHYRQNAELRLRLNRYVHVLMSQLAHTAACVRYHDVEERLARWLLMTRDRAHGDRFRLTHQFLAYMLGVRRVGVTVAARSLQAQGLIEYERGDITILDRSGLQQASCSCYQRSTALYQQTMRTSPASRPS